MGAEMSSFSVVVLIIFMIMIVSSYRLTPDRLYRIISPRKQFMVNAYHKAKRSGRERDNRARALAERRARERTTRNGEPDL